eukprot:13473165-Ditylum_brightwellii.AAC.1
MPFSVYVSAKEGCSHVKECSDIIIQANEYMLQIPTIRDGTSEKLKKGVVNIPELGVSACLH